MSALLSGMAAESMRLNWGSPILLIAVVLILSAPYSARTSTQDNQGQNARMKSAAPFAVAILITASAFFLATFRFGGSSASYYTDMESADNSAPVSRSVVDNDKAPLALNSKSTQTGYNESQHVNANPVSNDPFPAVIPSADAEVSSQKDESDLPPYSARINEDITVQITSAVICQVLLASSFDDSVSATSERALTITLRIENGSANRKYDYAGWGADVLNIVDTTAKLSDDFGNDYSAYFPDVLDTFVTVRNQGGNVVFIRQKEDATALYPGDQIADLLVFEVPIAEASSLTLAFPESAINGSLSTVTLDFPTNNIVSRNNFTVSEVYQLEKYYREAY